MAEITVDEKTCEEVKVDEQTYEEVKHDGKMIAIILREKYTHPVTTFYSPSDFSQQLGYIVYKKGGVIKPHFHKEIQREIKLTQEVLFVKKGKLIVNFYTNKKEYVDSRQLVQGDTIFLCSGGHGFEMQEDTEMIEVKQGPYSGRDSDKVTFEGVEHDSRE